MKKLLIFLLILVAFVGGVAAGEFWFGKKTEEAFNQILRDLTEDKTILVRQHDYSRGLISSKATTVADTSTGHLRISLNNKLHHGPFPVEDLIAGKIDFKPILAKIVSRAEVVDKSAKSKKPIVVNSVTIIDFDGNQSTTVRSPAASHKDEDGTLVKWQAVTGLIESDQNSQGVHGTFSLPKLTLEKTGGITTLGPVDIRYNLENNQLGLSLGKVSAEIGKLSVGDTKGPKLVEVSNLRVASSTNIKGRLFGYSMGIKTGQINYEGERYGPGDFQLVLKGVEAKAIARLQKSATSGGKSGASGGLMGGSAFMDLMGSFGKTKPAIETSLSLKTQGGEMKGRGKVSLKGDLAGAAGNPFALLSSLNAVGVVSLPGNVVINAAAFQIRNELDAMVSSGKIPELDPKQKSQIVSQAVAGRISKWVSENWLVIKEKNLYQMDAKYENGNLSFNGQPVNMLQGLMQGG